jgi:hypothetical protein
MIPLIEQHRAEIEAICRKYGVAKLELFGSAARGEDFDPEKSDVDFFYEFDPATYDTHPISLPDRYFGTWEELEALLGRKVDFVSARNVTNRYFLRSANKSRVTLYAA